MTLEIPSDLQEQIERAAALRGTTPQSFVLEATRRALEDVPTQGSTTTRSFGFLKGQVEGSDTFLSHRHSEARDELDKEAIHS